MIVVKNLKFLIRHTPCTIEEYRIYIFNMNIEGRYNWGVGGGGIFSGTGINGQLIRLPVLASL